MYDVYRLLFSMDIIGAIELNADGNSKKTACDCMEWVAPL